MTARDQALATYAQIGAVDPTLADYFPKWLDTMTDDVILEGSMFDGAIQGRDAVRNVVITIRACYERQQHTFAGEKFAGLPYADQFAPAADK